MRGKGSERGIGEREGDKETGRESEKVREREREGRGRRDRERDKKRLLFGNAG